MSPRMLVTISIAAAVLFTNAPVSAAAPPGAEGAKSALEKSPRHGEWADIKAEGYEKPVRSYVVYPEVKDKAPVVIVIHEIFGLTDWVRAVADQLAADGFIAIAPDFLSGMGPNGGGTEAFAGDDDVRGAVRGLDAAKVDAVLNAVRAYGEALPASNGKTTVVGYCWGGAQSFRYATVQPKLAAAVVYYGTSPDAAALDAINAPVLGLYGENDARVNKTIEPAAAKLKELGKTYETHIFPGAGHGFLRQQEGQDGANKKAADEAWPKTVEFLKKHTGSAEN